MNAVVTAISIIGAIQGFILTFTLLFLKENSLKANKYLAAVLFILSVTLIIAFLHFTRLVLYVPHFFSITPIFTLLYGPLLLFYVSLLLRPNYSVRPWQLLHFVPLLIQIKIQLPFLVWSGARKNSYLMNIFEDRYLPALSTEAVARILHLLIYLAICYAIGMRAARQTSAKDNGVQTRRIVWTRILIGTSMIIWGVYTFLYFYDQNVLNFVAPVMITICTYALGFFGFKYPEIFRNIEIKKLSPKYSTSRLTERDKERHSKELVRIVHEEKLFTDPGLKLQDLANSLNLSVQNLSQIINEKFNQNFSEFINSFRVEEAQKLLLDSNNKHLTILAIAHEVGFNSKSAFNIAFKKHTSQTPSQFIKEKNNRPG